LSHWEHPLTPCVELNISFRFPDKFHDIRDEMCECKLPCQSTAYQPTFSYLKASEFDIEKILENSGDLKKKHAKARDALQTTKAEDWEKDKILLAPFRQDTSYTVFTGPCYRWAALWFLGRP
jgi:hypothetical protein